MNSVVNAWRVHPLIKIETVHLSVFHENKQRLYIIDEIFCGDNFGEILFSGRFSVNNIFWKACVVAVLDVISTDLWSVEMR